MNEIKCPNCGKIFKIDEMDYESIVKQIRDHEFEKELKREEDKYNKDKELSLKLLESKLNEEYQRKISDKEIMIKDLENKLKTQEELLTKNMEIKYQSDLNKKEMEINNLKNKLDILDSEKQKEIEIKDKEYQIKEASIKEKYESKLKDKEEQIAYYKDFKARQSTKMVGESLEVHCNNEFNKLRPLFKNATFNKDNDSKTGSKGDFIFRDFDDDNNEIVSIMFEMKNENDLTATKHKNEDFLKELDKDRREKHCEYAVLVSLLEIDNDYYNEGIVDVSHLYDKMYVIRPQFFIPMITLIRNLSSKALEYKKELNILKNQNIDITHFEDNINKFKEGFGRNYRLASERFSKAIIEIDNTIDHLNKIKENLLKTDDNLRLANNKVEDLTIKKLTYNNETMKKMFKDLEQEKLDI